MLQEINERYGKYIWKIANRYHTGIWDPEDVFNQILIQIYTAINSGKLKSDDSEETRERTHSLIISRAINIIRHEVRQYHLSLERGRLDDELHGMDLTASPSEESVKLEIELIRELLFTRLDSRTATFIFELAFPSERTVSIAIKEREIAKRDEALRMNIHNDLRILPKHVAKSLHYGASGTNTSRLCNKARNGMNDYFNISTPVGRCGLVDQIVKGIFDEKD